MTQEQLQDIRVGSVIHARLTVIDYDWTKKERNVCAWSEGCTGRIWLKPDEIVHVLPRPLEAGDRVWVPWSINQDVGTVLAVDEVAAWVKWPNDERVSYLLSDLQREEEG